MGDEAFQEDRNGLLAPGINLARTPFDGRNAEFMGEDPFLAGTIAAGTIQGIQTGNPTEPVEAVVKHYVGNDQETDRQTSSSNIDERTLEELDSRAFEIAVRDGQSAGVMCSYNQINGTYACENPLLTTDLKSQIGLKGFVVSDFGAVHSTAPSLVAGLDQELNRPRFYAPANLESALSSGQITQAQVDAAAHRVVYSAIAEGLFDHPMPATPNPNSSTAAHLALATTIEEEGATLLKNGGALPITGHGLKIAVIGPTASATATSGVSAKTVCSSSGEPSNACSNNPGFSAPLTAITTRAAQDGDTVTFDNGSSTTSAAAAAGAADVAVVFAYYTEGEGSDRITISGPSPGTWTPRINADNNGDALVSGVAAANPHTIVVLETGSAVLMPWLGQVNGVLEAWYPGVEGGNAISALLFGDANPSGKLPVTFPNVVADLPTAGSNSLFPGILAGGGIFRASGDTSIRQVNYSEGLKMGYRWYNAQGIAPLFPFGYGLSYTTFTEHLASVTADGNGGADAAVQVANTGSRAGSQVVEIYVQDPASAGEPSSQLEGYTRVQLAAGASQTVDVHLGPWAFAHWVIGTGWQVDGGPYAIQLGTDATTVVDSATITLPACTLGASETTATCVPTSVSALQRVPVSGTVAPFDAYSPTATAGQYAVSIDWGDGSAATAGTVTSTGGGGFAVTGSHTYAASGPFTITTTISDNAPFAGGQSTTTTSATVAKPSLTVTADDKTRLFGQPNPPFTTTITGFVAGDSPSVVSGSAACSTTAVPSSPAGPYPITCTLGTLSVANYIFGPFVPGTLTVTYSQPCIATARSGPLTVNAGEALCIAAGANISGPVTVQPGGALDIDDGATVTGPVRSTGATLFRMCGSTVAGPLTVTGTTGLVLIGGDAATGPCAGNAFTGPVSVTGNTGGVEFNSNNVTGPLHITGNTGSLPPPDTGPVRASSNTVTGPTNVQ
jgi:beta-glucosidase